MTQGEITTNNNQQKIDQDKQNNPKKIYTALNLSQKDLQDDVLAPPTEQSLQSSQNLESKAKLENKNTQQNVQIPISQQQLQQNEINIDKQNSLFYKATFCLLGISSLIGWNAVLNSFPFFAQKYGFRVYNAFTISLQVGTFITGAILPFIAHKISVVWRITFSMVLIVFILAALPIIAQFLPSEQDNSSEIGFILSIILTFILGGLNSFVQNSMAGLASQVGGKLCGLFWLSNGLSGLSMCILQIICVFVFPPRENEGLNPNSTIVFFTFAVFLSIVSAILSKNYAKKEKLDQKTEKKNDNFNKENLKKAIKQAGLMPFFIFFIYLVTFSVFPGLMLANIQFENNFLSEQNGLWGIQLLTLTFFVGDVLGRKMGSYQIFYKKIPQYILSGLRSIFVVFAIIVAYKEGQNTLNNDWFPFLNMFLMAFTNGFGTSCIMALGSIFGKGDKKLGEVIGLISTFMLTLGIALGSLIAYPLAPSQE